MPSLLVLAPKHDTGERQSHTHPVHGPATGGVIPLRAPEVVFGRDAEGLRSIHPDAQIVHLPTRCINRIHATLRREGTLFTIDDAGSRNGTFLNGNLVKGTVFLRDGDEIRMGDFVFLFRDDTGWEAYTIQGLDKVMLGTLLSLLSCGRPERELSRLLRLIGVVNAPAGGRTFLLVVRPEQVSVLATVVRVSESERGELAAQWGETEELRTRREEDVFAMLRGLGDLAESTLSQGTCLLLWQNTGESR